MSLEQASQLLAILDYFYEDKVPYLNFINAIAAGDVKIPSPCRQYLAILNSENETPKKKAQHHLMEWMAWRCTDYQERVQSLPVPLKSNLFGQLAPNQVPQPIWDWCQKNGEWRDRAGDYYTDPYYDKKEEKWVAYPLIGNEPGVIPHFINPLKENDISADFKYLHAINK